MTNNPMTFQQIDAMIMLAQYTGQTVLVLTSGYTANIAPQAVSDAVATINAATLRGLEARGHIAIKVRMWKGRAHYRAATCHRPPNGASDLPRRARGHSRRAHNPAPSAVAAARRPSRGPRHVATCSRSM